MMSLGWRLIDAFWPAVERVAELLVERGRQGGLAVARILMSQR
jgi:hypothetical protein